MNNYNKKYHEIAYHCASIRTYMAQEINPKHQQLYDILSEKWPLVKEEHYIGSESFELWYIQEVDQLIEELLAKGEDHPDVKDERLPYWADIWASSIGLSEFIVENKNLVKGKTILEIGCGIGLPGIVAARCGATVCMTDYLEEALQMARLNWHQNIERQGKFEIMDWREPKRQLRADIVLASDVAYEERAFQPLINAFPHLIKKGGELWISEPNRAWAKPFFESLNQKGWIKQSQDFSVEQPGLTSQVSVYRLRL